MKPLAIFPERVPCIAMNQPYASLLFGVDGEPGRKRFETRTWWYPYPPGWLAIYATKTSDRGAIKRLGAEGVISPAMTFPLGAILGAVWIDGCRRMVHEDARDACYPFDPCEDRYVWEILSSREFIAPDRSTLTRGPQKFVFIPGEVIARQVAL